MEKKWLSDGFNISYPYDWQRPARTEEWTWDYLNSSSHKSNFIEFVSFPWATLIDLIARKQDDRVNILIEDLNKIPPKKKLIRATMCQHINLKEIIHLLKRLKITDIFWPHKIYGENIINGIRLHPYVLYPYAYFERKEIEHDDILKIKYIISFVGAYDARCYISNIRDRIFKFTQIKESLFIRRENWHFEVDVYQSQINNINISSDVYDNQKKMLNEYIESISKTLFVLCPSGAGPNTIRLWETIAFGRIPVLLSDTLELPNIKNIFNGMKISENSYEQFLYDIKNKEKLQILEFHKDLLSLCENNGRIQPEEWLENIFTEFYSNQNLKNLVGFK
jgi:hypothetical protein